MTPPPLSWAVWPGRGAWPRNYPTMDLRLDSTVTRGETGQVSNFEELRHHYDSGVGWDTYPR